MLKPGDELYIFADPAQTIFCDEIEKNPELRSPGID
jgi:hypothetical protein